MLTTEQVARFDHDGYVVVEDLFTDADLQRSAVVLLNDVPATPALAARLQRYVDGGCGLFVALGPKALETACACSHGNRGKHITRGVSRRRPSSPLFIARAGRSGLCIFVGRRDREAILAKMIHVSSSPDSQRPLRVDSRLSE